MILHQKDNNTYLDQQWNLQCHIH